MANVNAKYNADEALARMGYQSELPRNLSMLSVLGLYVLVYTHTPTEREREREIELD